MPEQPVVSELRYGVFFGECIGYCRESIAVSAQEVRYIKQSNVPGPAMPDIVRQRMLRPGEWDAIVASADREILDRLPARIGRPDESDRGGEWIEVDGTDRKTRFELEYEARIPELDELLDSLRRLRVEMSGT